MDFTHFEQNPVKAAKAERQFATNRPQSALMLKFIQQKKNDQLQFRQQGNLNHGNSQQQYLKNSKEFLPEIKKDQDEAKFAKYPDLMKLRPKNIKDEKEKLFMESTSLKNEISNSSFENQKLTNKLLSFGNQNAKLQKVIEDVEEYLNTHGGLKPATNIHQSFVVQGLKKQIKEVKSKIKEKQNELWQLQKNPKILKSQELEIELQTYSEQATYLQNLVEQLEQQYQKSANKFENEEQQIKQQEFEELQEENARLMLKFKQLDEKNINLQTIKEQEEKKNKKIAQEVQDLTQVIEENNETINALEEEIQEFLEQKQQLEEKQQMFENEKMNAFKINTNENEIRELINEKDEIIHMQEKSLNQLKNQLKQLQQQEEYETIQQNEELKRLKNAYKQLEQQNQELLDQYRFELEKQNQLNFKNIEESEDEQNNINVNKTQNQEKLKRVQKVKHSDIEQYGYELKLRFILKRIPLEKFEKILKQKLEGKSMVSIRELQQILKNKPFEVDLLNTTQTSPDNSMEKSLLIARYLVEDNSEDFLFLDLNRTENITRVISVFKKMVSDYELYTEEQDITYRKEVAKIISKSRGNLISSLEYVSEQKKFISLKQVQTAFNLLNIHISTKQFEYLILQLFKLSNNLDKLEFAKIFEIFRLEEAQTQYNAMLQKQELQLCFQNQNQETNFY